MLKKTITSLLLAVAAAGLLAAAETEAVKIDTDLLNKAHAETYIDDKSPITWKYYSTGKQIRDMGRRLGEELKFQEQVKKVESPYASGSPSFKYKVVRIYPGTKAGADVLYINKNARVNTIKNLRRVVSGYIEKAYDIPMEQADEIAKKVCYWNTNHYNDKEFFRANFQVRVREVFSNRTKIIGLARSYKNWPGKTRIVIPFVLIKETVPDAVEPAAPQPEVKEPEPQPENLQPENDTTDVAPAPAPTAAPKKGLPLFSIILICLLVLAVIVLVILFVKRASDKKRENTGSGY